MVEMQIFLARASSLKASIPDSPVKRKWEYKVFIHANVIKIDMLVFHSFERIFQMGINFHKTL